MWAVYSGVVRGEVGTRCTHTAHLTQHMRDLVPTCHSQGVCTHTGKTGVGSDSIAGCNVNEWVLSHAAGPAELPANLRAGLELDKPDAEQTSSLCGLSVSK